MEANRKEYLDNLRVDHIMGTLVIDPDDPRTTAGLTDEEVEYIRSNACYTACLVCHAPKGEYESCCDESDLFRE